MAILRDAKRTASVVLRALSHDRNLPEHALRMAELHMRSPWIEGFGAVLLNPLRGGLGRFLNAPACTTGGIMWFVPSAQFWKAHAKASHPPDGSGCDAGVHRDFLTEEGQYAEFAYAYLLDDGIVRTAEAADFRRECEWWRENF